MFSLRDFFELSWLNFVVLWRNFFEYVRVVLKYYPKFAFAKADFSMILMYFFNNPFSISKRFLMKRGEKEIYTYGETPLTTLDHIAKVCALKASDCVFELGAGRGRGCFWLRYFVGCEVVGIEYVPDFVERAELIRKKLDIQGVEFREADILQADLKGASVIYLYGTCYDQPFIEKLIQRLSQLPSGTKIITVSYPLSDYTPKPLFEVMKRFPAKYTWGTADVYFQIRK
jgi:hypothetical protein